ncbi:hypothetical protein J2Z83_003276 [Virgibacillus natechei]|uniref:Zinc ribbon domain-containing protein n=1 Tax=Virgibacillus natechei TaxID=1216297 RepID=A0ABS4IJJ4_9BACI|nr:hypothetical protein [Virgibacillus natechei]MBP1971137.1 hypothetical protein [Virgibacillus natechei]UZD12177.1 hypothetical protein OLD84_14750 [Virgibacillus natechei]
MLVCSSCSENQESGKFCGNCGGSLQPAQGDNQQQGEINAGTEQFAATAAKSQPAPQVEPQAQQTTETIKNGLRDYWAYALGLIKNPTDSFRSGEDHFINGLVTMALYALAFSLSIYFFISNSFMGPLDPSFFEFNFKFTLAIVAFLAITFGITFAITRLAKSQELFKTVISQYGGLLVPFTALNIVAVIGGLAGSPFLVFAPLAVSSIFTFLFIPVLYVFEKSSQVNNQGQKIYFSLITLLFIGLGFYILGEVIISSILSDLTNRFPF